jgi:citronellyl-CoA dehydrogenase
LASDALRQEFLAPAIAGDMVGCIGVSEPGAGSDVAALKTRARKDGDDYIINGSKMWITNGMQADWCCLLANTSDGAAHKNKSLIMVPMNAPGITRQKIEKIGMDSSDTAQLFFDNVRVPSATASARKAWASCCRCCSSRKSACTVRPVACARWTI